MKTADKLRKFRQECEKETEQPADHIEVSLLHLLHDVCSTLRMSKCNTSKVLGRKGVHRLVNEREWTARLVDRE